MALETTRSSTATRTVAPGAASPRMRTESPGATVSGRLATSNTGAWAAAVGVVATVGVGRWVAVAVGSAIATVTVRGSDVAMVSLLSSTRLTVTV
jgi:hypothetical protein